MTTMHVASAPADASPMSRFVTPSLYLGQPYLPGTQRCATWTEAVAVISTGGTAVLPEGDYEGAAKTLEALGCSRSVTRSRVHFAKHGTLL